MCRHICPHGVLCLNCNPFACIQCATKSYMALHSAAKRVTVAIGQRVYVVEAVVWVVDRQPHKQLLQRRLRAISMQGMTDCEQSSRKTDR